ncbi:flagellar hook-length control protein FliK [Poseidonocella sedimentorum]|uniref:Hook-length control protein FliK n=1 Tax=Poseidonocella sedimentorum TaxID=871652 RepID=A0A1I6D542_9RHOB|nr:flagellar hook-length control protein FliK [Poseidonocella sedimentorum]SFR00609.1 hook-length control protein FliK [Poseidonocella sedimentorum]
MQNVQTMAAPAPIAPKGSAPGAAQAKGDKAAEFSDVFGSDAGEEPVVEEVSGGEDAQADGEAATDAEVAENPDAVVAGEETAGAEVAERDSPIAIWPAETVQVSKAGAAETALGGDAPAEGVETTATDDVEPAKDVPRNAPLNDANARAGITEVAVKVAAVNGMERGDAASRTRRAVEQTVTAQPASRTVLSAAVDEAGQGAVAAAKEQQSANSATPPPAHVKTEAAGTATVQMATTQQRQTTPSERPVESEAPIEDVAPRATETRRATPQAIRASAPTPLESIGLAQLSAAAAPAEAAKGLTDFAVVDEVFAGSGPVSERVEMSAAAQTSATMRAPVAAQHVAAQLAEVVRNGREGAIEVSLKPAELGHVRMIITQTDTGLQVSIGADRPETADLMRKHADSLQKEFADAGFGSVNFTFEEDASGSDGGREGGAGNNSTTVAMLDGEGAAEDGTPVSIQGTLSDGLDIRI